MEQVQAEFLDYQGMGVSIVEVSHRGSDFLEIVEQLQVNLRRVLSVPEDFEIIFSAGGGQGQFACLPMNLIDHYKTAAYLITGHWSQLAFEEAKRYTDPVCVAHAKETHFHAVPERSTWQLPDSAAYLYCCDNETVHGLMLAEVPDVGFPVVCDMTSSLMTRPVDWGRYGAVIAGCQKNIAPAGMAIVILRKDLLARQAIQQTPTILNYQTLVKSQSLPNTPTTFSWYVANLVCEWVIKQGGVDEMLRRCNARAKILYDCIDQSDFYSNDVDPQFRSTINICFHLKDESLEKHFLASAENEGLLSLQGHRVVGGLRANLYNAMPIEGAQKLVDFMRDFEEKFSASSL
jgi:phosphoserine aminotransferase